MNEKSLGVVEKSQLNLSQTNAEHVVDVFYSILMACHGFENHIIGTYCKSIGSLIKGLSPFEVLSLASIERLKSERAKEALGR